MIDKLCKKSYLWTLQGMTLSISGAFVTDDILCRMQWIEFPNQQIWKEFERNTLIFGWLDHLMGKQTRYQKPFKKITLPVDWPPYKIRLLLVKAFAVTWCILWKWNSCCTLAPNSCHAHCTLQVHTARWRKVKLLHYSHQLLPCTVHTDSNPKLWLTF